MDWLASSSHIPAVQKSIVHTKKTTAPEDAAVPPHAALNTKEVSGLLYPHRHETTIAVAIDLEQNRTAIRLTGFANFLCDLPR